MTQKEKAIRDVIEKRVGIIKKAIPYCKDEKDVRWYKGRVQGLMDAYDLLGDSLESIKIEL